MNKKFLIILTISLFTANYFSAQTVNVGVRGGISVPNIVSISDNALSSGYSSRFSGGGGLFTELDINSRFSIRFGVEYSSQGGKRNGIQGMSTNQMVTDIVTRIGASIPQEILSQIQLMTVLFPPVFYADVRNTAKFDYLMIPVSLQTGLFKGVIKNNPWQVYVNAGPFISFLFSAKQISQGLSKLYAAADKSETLYDRIPVEYRQPMEEAVPAIADILKNGTEFGTSTITGEIRPINFGFQGNLGFSYSYNQNHRFFIEAGGNYGLVRIQKDKANGSNHLGTANVMFGYAFTLTKNK